MMRLIELPGGREHPGRRRFTIDVTPMSPKETTSDGEHLRPNAVFTVNGELDAEAAAIGRSGLRYLDNFSDVTVDLSGITLVTSAGLRLIETAQQRVQERGGRFAITDPSLIVRRVFDIVDVAFERAAPNDLHPTSVRPSPKLISTHRHATAVPR